jgi:hypothetical protein
MIKRFTDTELLEQAVRFTIGYYFPEHYTKKFPIWLEKRENKWVIYSEIGGDLRNTHCLGEYTNASPNFVYKQGTAWVTREKALEIWYCYLENQEKDDLKKEK